MSTMSLVIGFIVMVSCTVVANLLLKLGAVVPPDQRMLFGLFDWRTQFCDESLH